jgi:histidinol phosphatase-like PHP family hydrolase
MHCEQTLTEHSSSVEALVSTPTGMVFSAAADNVVRVCDSNHMAIAINSNLLIVWYLTHCDPTNTLLAQ